MLHVLRKLVFEKADAKKPVMLHRPRGKLFQLPRVPSKGLRQWLLLWRLRLLQWWLHWWLHWRLRLLLLLLAEESAKLRRACTNQGPVD